MAVVLAVSAMTMLFALHAETDAASAQIVDSGQCGPNAAYSIYSDGTLEITGSGEMNSYISVRAPWFESRDDITKIVIGDNITKLGEWAFLMCNQVKELTIPITLNSVGSDMHPAFAVCCHIEKINFTIGNGGYGYNYAAYDGSGSWYQNTPWHQSRDTLKEINLADGIRGVGSDAFRELSNVTSLVLPDSVVHLGNHCFLNCTGLTDLTIPVSLNSYGSNEKYPAFCGCTAVEKVTFTNGNGVPFDYTHWSWGTSPENTALAPWNMNSDVPKTIVIKDSVSKLGKCMFYGCNLKELTIPISIDVECGNSYISPFDYRQCHENLEKVTFTQGSGKSCDYNLTYYGDCPWYNAPSLKTVIYEEGITRIGQYALYGCNIEDLVLPNTLTSFGLGVFRDCTIKNLTIPVSLNAVWRDDYPAFHNISGIESITFTPGSGCGFNYSAYDGEDSWYQNTPWYQCRSTLKSIVFEEGIIRLGSDAFRELNLDSLVIPFGVVCLSFHTFYKSSITELTIPASLDTVFSETFPAFEGCYLETVHFTAGYFGPTFNDTGEEFPWPDARKYPPWANLLIRPTTVTKMTFDSDICHYWADTFIGFTFYGKSGEEIEACGSNLSGKTFVGEYGIMHEVDDGADSPTLTGPDLTTTTEPDTARGIVYWIAQQLSMQTDSGSITGSPDTMAVSRAGIDGAFQECFGSERQAKAANAA